MDSSDQFGPFISLHLIDSPLSIRSADQFAYGHDDSPHEAPLLE